MNALERGLLAAVVVLSALLAAALTTNTMIDLMGFDVEFVSVGGFLFLLLASVLALIFGRYITVEEE